MFQYRRPRFKFYLEREYQCLGQWNENDVVYAFTKRQDVRTFECFVGTMTSNQDIFIKEAGEHCQRDIDPNRYGMQLRQTKYCNNNRRKIAKMPSHKSIMQLIAAAAANGTDFGISLSGPIDRHHINFDISMNSTPFDEPIQVNTQTNSLFNDGIQFIIKNDTNTSIINNSDHYVVSTVNITNSYDVHSTSHTSTTTKHPPFSKINESDFNNVISITGSNNAFIIICSVSIILYKNVFATW